MAHSEDILDGYFPLRMSVADLMQRRGLVRVRLEMRFAPILTVDGLPHDAPVPLNIQSGRAGMIYHAVLEARPGDSLPNLTGAAHWHWFDGTPAKNWLDPMTRLAEPALVSIRQLSVPVQHDGIRYVARAL